MKVGGLVVLSMAIPAAIDAWFGFPKEWASYVAGAITILLLASIVVSYYWYEKDIGNGLGKMPES